MTEISALWLPILLSSVVVFVLSSIIHMMSPWHKSDYPPLPNEDAVMDALRPLNIPPGDYMFPRPVGREAMRSPEFLAKRAKGPVGMMTIMPSGSFAMGPYLIKWFIYLVIVSALSACVAAAALPPGATDHKVLHFVGITAFTAYAVALWQFSIWYHRSWLTTFKATVDSVIYAAATAGIFAYMWPK